MNDQRQMAVLLLCSMLLLPGCRTGAQPNATLFSGNRQHLAPSGATPAIALDSPNITLASYQEDAPAVDAAAEAERTLRPVLSEPIVVAPIEFPDGEVLGLSLQDAIRIGLERNPDLTAVRAGEPVARGVLGVAQTYPFNPQFQTQVLPYSRDRSGDDGAVSQQHVVVQTFELGGQQQYREGVAVGALGQIRSTINQAELMNVAQTTRLYFTAAYQRELLDLNQVLTGMNEAQIGVIERREKAGLANAADVALAKLQVQASRRQQRLSEANYQTALLALRTQLNLAQEMPMELSSQWESTRWQEVDESYVEQIVSSRPDVVAARAAVAAARANLCLADAMRRPNLQAGPMYQRDNSSTVFWGVQAQIDIPVVNTGGPLVQQRYAELRQQQVIAQQLRQRAMLEAQAAIGRYARARQMVEDSRGEVVADVMQALKPFEDQFQAGQITLLQVFAARTTLAQAQQSYLDLLNEVSQAAVDVTQASGLPPEQLFSLEIISPQ